MHVLLQVISISEMKISVYQLAKPKWWLGRTYDLNKLIHEISLCMETKIPKADFRQGAPKRFPYIKKYESYL